MKHSFLERITPFLVGLLVLVFLLSQFVHRFPLSLRGPVLKEPPAGWVIETNGVVFRWKTPNGYSNIFEEKTRQEAIDSAWSFYEYQKRRSKWRPVE